MGRIISRRTVQSSTVQYDVIIGEDILDQVSDSDAVTTADFRGIIVSKRVYSLHLAKLNAAFPPSSYFYLVMNDGEDQKNFLNAEKYLCALLENGFSRKSVLIAIGGGVVGDFTGFVASLYMRGIRIIQVPTTLLSMVDSSIGGKTAVNIGAGKNIAGAFHPPSLVAADISFLDTLPDDQWREGLSECIKHALIGEKDLYSLLKNNNLDTLKFSENRGELVSLSAGFKIGIVSRDEKELGERAILNFGHTVGHSIESALKYEISHGTAVGIGMKIIAVLSEVTGLITKDDENTIFEMIDAYGIAPVRELPSPDELLMHMKYDKKNDSGTIRFVLLKGIFLPIYNVSVGSADVRRAIKVYTGRE
jgi:3-dehydroquinate synthase